MHRMTNMFVLVKVLVVTSSFAFVHAQDKYDLLISHPLEDSVYVSGDDILVNWTLPEGTPKSALEDTITFFAHFTDGGGNEQRLNVAAVPAGDKQVSIQIEMPERTSKVALEVTSDQLIDGIWSKQFYVLARHGYCSSCSAELTIYDNIRAMKGSDALIKLLDQTGAAAELQSSDFKGAFFAFNPSPLDQDDDSSMMSKDERLRADRDLVKYHMIKDEFLTTQLLRGQRVLQTYLETELLPSSQVQLARVTRKGALVEVDNGGTSRVIIKVENLRSSNGVLHVIDGILYSPPPIGETLAAASPEHPFTKGYLTAEHEAVVLESKVGVTMFAPLLAEPKPGDVDWSSSDVIGHAVEGIMYSADLRSVGKEGREFTTLDSRTIRIFIDENNDMKIQGDDGAIATIRRVDIFVENGVLHFIDHEVQGNRKSSKQLRDEEMKRGVTNTSYTTNTTAQGKNATSAKSKKNSNGAASLQSGAILMAISVVCAALSFVAL